jgi:ribosomal 50S subunit-associated protein YjgA (DUF615 family)
MTWTDQAGFECWDNLQHDAGQTYVVVTIGTIGRKQSFVAIRRKLESLRSEHVKAEAALARAELARVLRAAAAEVEKGCLPA